eukprot:Cvel_20358.t1-p1 / transcript=Cvel_20358.t1 / gene=Cvel_20358 / organism=Chromera_velia_CCMP2878 / gene_product=Sideroflexin-5, putative / transcript_product=Sideroflexin-5, putative / location=Cvel_scaffold1820:34563-37753(+) / protein_length=305 / sequence_SO=supercontig / SO=protein_coding / is_pseudo=false
MLVPPFDPVKPRYDQGTFMGRLMHFVTFIDPRLAFVFEKDVEEARKVLKMWKDGTLPSGVTDETLWEARTRLESAVHPQTDEMVPWMFRMSTFVPVNVPICAGMLFAPNTMFHNIFWQWINQTYNAGFNFCNGNKSADTDTKKLAMSYAGASFVSVGLSVGLRESLKRMQMSPGVRGVANAFVPFIASGAAGVANALMMRSQELFTGIEVVGENGEKKGVSKNAAQKALSEIAFSRVVLSACVLGVPPLLLGGLGRIGLPSAGTIRFLTEWTVVTGALAGALPLGVAVFPQQGEILCSQLEPEFR